MKDDLPPLQPHRKILLLGGKVVLDFHYIDRSELVQVISEDEETLSGIPASILSSLVLLECHLTEEAERKGLIFEIEEHRSQIEIKEPQKEARLLQVKNMGEEVRAGRKTIRECIDVMMQPPCGSLSRLRAANTFSAFTGIDLSGQHGLW